MAISFLETIRKNKHKHNNKCVYDVNKDRDRFYPSSKTCHSCGYVNKQLCLSDREWQCPNCGAIVERDYNAALNILDEGIRIIGSSTTEFTLVDYPLVDDKVVTPLKSNGRLKQENHNERMFNFVQV